MRNIKSYRLSAQLKAELNFKQKSPSSYLKNIRIDFRKIPFKGIAIFIGVFAVVISGYMGVKTLYEKQSAKNEQIRQAKLQSYQDHLAEIKAEVLNKNVDSDGYVALTQDYLKQKDIERAEQAAVLAVEKNPIWRDAYINQGHVMLVANKFELAKASFEKALEIDPLCGQAHYLLSLTYQELKDNTSAKASFAKAKQFGFETEIGG